VLIYSGKVYRRSDLRKLSKSENVEKVNFILF
jgi:hypothetical protein